MNGKTICTVIGIVGTVVSAVAGGIGMRIEVKETVNKELDRRKSEENDVDVDANFKIVEEES